MLKDTDADEYSAICFLFIVYESVIFFFFFQAEDGIRDYKVTGVQTCALPIFAEAVKRPATKPLHPYALDAPAEEKIRAIATGIYGAKGAELTAEAKKGLEKDRKSVV